MLKIGLVSLSFQNAFSYFIFENSWEDGKFKKKKDGKLNSINRSWETS